MHPKRIRYYLSKIISLTSVSSKNKEIHNSVDTDHRCMYFQQIENGVCMRMSILNSILNPNMDEK